MTHAGWKPDPNGKHQWRYWDGAVWTDKVSDGDGQTGVDAYDPDLVPPPPTGAPPPQGADSAPAQMQDLVYQLELFDWRNRRIHVGGPYRNPDTAIQFAEENPELRIRHSAGSILLKGAMRPNIVKWKTGVIFEINKSTGDQREYHRMKQ